MYIYSSQNTSICRMRKRQVETQLKALKQACQTQKTVQTAYGVLRAKKLSACRTLKILNDFYYSYQFL